MIHGSILSKRQNGNIGTIAKTILVIFISFLFIMPFIMMVLTSLKSSPEINSQVFRLFPQKLRFSNYYDVLASGNWGLFFFNSVFITVTTTLISLIFNSLAGFSFARLNFPFRDKLFFLLLLGLLVPIQINLVSVFLITKSLPLLGGNDIFGHGGMGAVDSYLGIMLPGLAGAFGVFLCRQFYIGFPKALDEASRIDGAGIWRIYSTIYLPLSKPLLASLAVLKITTVWNDYMWPLVITNSEKYRTVQLALAMYKNEAVRWEYLMAATTMVIIPIIIVFLSAQRFFVQGILTSGIKG